MTKEEQDINLNLALSKAYDYITNVIVKQKRILSLDDMYRGYESMHFKPTLVEDAFKDFYRLLLIDWKNRGFFK